MATPLQAPVIVVPGITASSLRDHYALDPENVWSILRKRYERIALHPDDLRYERDEPARVLPERLFSVAYDQFIAELRHNLAARKDQPVPVFPFAYDWRLPLEFIQEQLRALIDEVIGRTRLLRHYHAAGFDDNPVIDLVGHSMGGLIIAGYLAGSGDRRVRKVATIGTPYRGSFEAVLKVAVGTADLGPDESGSREREAARLTPALYHLLPSFGDGVITDDPNFPGFFDAAGWQHGVIETIAEFIRMYGLDAPRSKSGREDAARDLLQRILDEARRHRAAVEGFAPGSVGMTENDWLVIAGVGQTTRTQLVVEQRRTGPFFNLRSDERKNGYPRPVLGDSGVRVNLWETGDGTVPYAGALPSFVSHSRIVAVSPEDFGYWELRDRALGAVAGLHGLLPAMNLVQKLVVAFLKGEAGQPGRGHAGVWGRRAPDLALNVEWNPPIAGLRLKPIPGAAGLPVEPQ
jgi:pimeloyl-ACP methyl ester carboxylesterase